MAKLRADLAALVSGDATLDPRIANLVAGYRDGELPFFAYLSQPNNAANRAALEAVGARVLRTYKSVPVFALAANPANVLRVAARSFVSWLAPIELVFAFEEPVSQARATTEDVGAPPQWAAGITGTGVRIAILDTGVDPVHPDLDDLDFKSWSTLVNAPKVVEARDFNGGRCDPVVLDGHGHGTHVAGIATGTGEGSPDAADNGRYAGIAPGAELAVAKVLTDAGAGINSDLLAAMEWAAMPDSPGDPTSCSIGADIVNLSLGSEARPDRLNSDSDVDMISLVLNRLAVKYGTLFVTAAGNSGPYVGSVLEAAGSAAQALSVAAAAKDWDVNHDDTLSGDTCAGWQHPPATNEDDDCSGGVGTQPPSVASFSSRGPSGDVWLRPDLAAPGYNIVAPQSTTGAGIGSNDLARNTRADPLYATASGTSMAAPAAAGSAALVLDAYRQRYGGDPVGASGLSGMNAPAYALLRAALMNSASGDLYESRWILTTDTTTRFDCPDPDPLFGLCQIAEILADTGIGSLRLYDERNGAGDPYVGPLAEGAGKLRVAGAIAALRDGLVVYSAASGSGATAGTGHRDLQGSWQVGAVSAGSNVSQRFVLHAAPGMAKQSATFAFEPGHPSDGSRAIPTGAVSGAWTVTLPGKTNVSSGGNAIVNLGLKIPVGTPSGTYTGVVRITTAAGQVIRVPVFASVALHDPNVAAGNAPGPQARIASASDVFAKDDTIWPSAAGTAPTGSNADWLVYPVELAGGLSSARFSVYDAAAGNETYDLYLYDSRFDLITSTHPFAAPGVTDAAANSQRGASTPAAPQVLSLGTPAAGRHYVVVSRARIGGTTTGDFGAFVLTLDEIKLAGAAAPSQLAYEGDFIWTAGQAVRLAARLTNPAGSPTGTPIAGRQVSFTVDAGVGPCGGAPCLAVTNYEGIAQVASSAITLAPGIHEVHARFAGDSAWLASGGDAFVLVLGDGEPAPPPGGSAGKITAGGWFVPDDATGSGPSQRVQLAFHATSPGVVAPTGELRYRDVAGGLDLTLVAWTALLVNGEDVTLSGSARDAAGATVAFFLSATDAGEPGKGHDTIHLQVPDRGYDRSGTLGGGNIQIH